MNDILKIMKNHMRRNLFILLIAIFGSVLLCGVYQAGRRVADAYSVEEIPIGFLDHDDSALSADLSAYMSETLNMKLFTESSFDEQSALLIDRKIAAIVEVPEGFHDMAAAGTPISLELTTLDDYENAAFVEAYADTYMKSVSVLSQSAGTDPERFDAMLASAPVCEPISEESAVIVDAERDRDLAGSQFASGFFLMLVMGICMAITLSVIDDRLLGTFQRVRLSPVTAAHYVIGTALSGFLMSVVFGISLPLYFALSGAQTGIPLWLLLVIWLLFILFTVGLALIIAMISPSKQTATTITTSVATITCILGGAWFPLQDSGTVLSKLALLTPHYWFMDLIRNYPEDPSMNILPHLSVLALFVVMVYLIAAVIFTKNSKRI